MKRYISLLVALLLSLTLGSAPAQSVDPNVTIRVTDNSGNPWADGLANVNSSFANQVFRVVGGQASLLLPDGKHNITLRTSPPATNGNVSVHTFYFELQVTGKSVVDIQLPEIVEFAFDIGSPKSGFVEFGVKSYSKFSPEGSLFSGPNTSSTAKVTVGERKFEATGGGSLLTTRLETSLGSDLAMYLPFRGNLGLRVVDGILKFKTFAPIPLSREMPPTSQNEYTNFDFDGDGFRDYTYAFRLGANATKGVDVSYKQLMAGAVAAPLEGITDIQVEPFAGTISGSQFIVRGRVIASSPAYLPVSSPITLVVWQRFKMGTGGFSPLQVTLGRANLEADGAFTLRATLNQRILMSELVSPYFRILTPIGISSQEFALPEIVKKYKDCSAMYNDFRGGVAQSSTSKNKGAKTKQIPVVNPKVYALNKALDKDKDGIACER